MTHPNEKQAGDQSTTALIGIDWGTTSIRGYRIGANGEIQEQRAADKGILAINDGAFEAALNDMFGDWLVAWPCPVLLSGMITSRQGWVELPYVSCPVGRDELASHLTEHRLTEGRKISFVTGLAAVGRDEVPDVMRGEETQILGALGNDKRARLFVLPGTHSKWAVVRDGRVVSFATFMTGELYSILSRHSILGRMIDGDDHDRASFIQGVAYGRSSNAVSGGLLKRLFGSRALGLFEKIPSTGAASHLSGLLIGSEIREALDCLGNDAVPEAVTVLGETELTDLYITASSPN